MKIKKLPIISGNDIFMYNGEELMNAEEIREYITASMKLEIVNYVTNHNSVRHLFDHHSWHDDEGRFHEYNGQLGVCTYEKALLLIKQYKMQVFCITSDELYVTQEQIEDDEIRELLLSSPFKAFIVLRSLNLCKSLHGTLPYICQRHIDKFLGQSL